MNNKPLSANTLFHFTPKFEYIKNILVNGLYPRVSIETIYGSDPVESEDITNLIPMVCFCDIPLSQVSHHISKYGNYGIGLTKEWGIQNGITPVLYYHDDSQTFKTIQKTLRVANKIEQDIDTPIDHNLVALTLYIIYFCKPYKDKFHKDDDSVRFYDEREWRYVPAFDKWNSEVSFLFRSNFDDTKITTANSYFEQYPLKFNPDDIRYVIVEDENETWEMMEHIQRHEDYSDQDVKLLTTKLITIKQIKEDF
jgi:hypothetical protein